MIIDAEMKTILPKYNVLKRCDLKEETEMDGDRICDEVERLRLGTTFATYSHVTTGNLSRDTYVL